MLRRQKATCNIYIQNPPEILRRVFQCWLRLLNARTGDSAPQWCILGLCSRSDVIDDTSQLVFLCDVALVVRDFEAFCLCEGPESGPFCGGGRGLDVDAGGVATGLEDSEGEGDAQALRPAGYCYGAVCEGEEGVFCLI